MEDKTKSGRAKEPPIREDKTKSEPARERPIRVKNVAARTGFSERWIRELAACGVIPAFKVREGGDWFFWPSQIDAWLEGLKRDALTGYEK